LRGFIEGLYYVDLLRGASLRGFIEVLGFIEGLY